LGANLHHTLSYWRDLQGTWQDVSIESESGAVVSKATFDFEKAQLKQTIVVNNSQIGLKSEFLPKRNGCKLGGGMEFSLKTKDGAFLNLNSVDRFLFSHDLTSESQVLSVQAKLGNVQESKPVGLNAHFWARPGEPQEWPYKISLNCTGRKVKPGYADADWTAAEYGTFAFEHAASVDDVGFTEGDEVYLQCGNRYVAPGKNGRAVLAKRPVPLKLSIPDKRCIIPRIGHEIELPGDFQHVRWLGPGPWDTYVDRLGAKVDEWAAKVSELTFEYGRNQANGNKHGVHWMELRSNSQNVAVKAMSGERLLEMQAHHFPQRLFDAKDVTNHGNYEPRNQTVIHGGELVPQPGTWLSIDAKQMGVGGINSWGMLPLPSARVAFDAYSWDTLFLFEDVGETNAMLV